VCSQEQLGFSALYNYESVVSLAPSYSVGALTNHASCMQPSLDIFNEHVGIAMCPFDSIIYSARRVPQCRHPTLGRCLHSATSYSATSYFCVMLLLGEGRWSILAVTHLGDNRLFILQNAASTYGDYVDFLTIYLSLVHVITPDDLVGTVSIKQGEIVEDDCCPFKTSVWWSHLCTFHVYFLLL